MREKGYFKSAVIFKCVMIAVILGLVSFVALSVCVSQQANADETANFATSNEITEGVTNDFGLRVDVGFKGRDTSRIDVYIDDAADPSYTEKKEFIYSDFLDCFEQGSNITHWKVYRINEDEASVYFKAKYILNGAEKEKVFYFFFYDINSNPQTETKIYYQKNSEISVDFPKEGLELSPSDTNCHRVHFHEDFLKQSLAVCGFVLNSSYAPISVIGRNIEIIVDGETHYPTYLDNGYYFIFFPADDGEIKCPTKIKVVKEGYVSQEVSVSEEDIIKDETMGYGVIYKNFALQPTDESLYNVKMIGLDNHKQFHIEGSITTPFFEKSFNEDVVGLNIENPGFPTPVEFSVDDNGILSCDYAYKVDPGTTHDFGIWYKVNLKITPKPTDETFNIVNWKINDVDIVAGSSQEVDLSQNVLAEVSYDVTKTPVVPESVVAEAPKTCDQNGLVAIAILFATLSVTVFLKKSLFSK